MTEPVTDPASFKDPAGFVFQYEGKFFRCVHAGYAPHYRQLMQSGLYEALVTKAWLLPHTEQQQIPAFSGCHTLLLPEQLTSISYAYEWSFDMLKDAALLTLNINLAAIAHGMVLKDATPFNIQFHKGKPVFIDTLSFETYHPSKPWIAYRQFCEMFLFPLYLAHYLNMEVSRLLAAYPGGIPVSATASLLPLRSRLNMGVWLHVHLQHTITSNRNAATSGTAFNSTKLKQLLQYLHNITGRLAMHPVAAGNWSNYYEGTILSKAYLLAKETLFRSFVTGIAAEKALDLGANDGYFSRILASQVKEVMAVDADSQCINRLYLSTREESSRILPIVIDITQPSPGAGFNNREQRPFLSRAKSDLVVALALVHHLVFTNNIPLHLVADCMAGLTLQQLIIEFVPITDEKVQQLIQNKTSWHLPYDAVTFEQLFSKHFNIAQKAEIGNSGRILYRMKKK